MGSLKYWARKDDPDGYEKIRKESLENLIIKSIKKEKASGAHSDVANVISSDMSYNFNSFQKDVANGSIELFDTFKSGTKSALG